MARTCRREKGDGIKSPDFPASGLAGTAVTSVGRGAKPPTVSPVKPVRGPALYSPTANRALTFR
jgi:hypothetical protein